MPIVHHMLAVRTPQDIAQALFGSSGILTLTPDHHCSALEISGDCVFLNAQQARRETQGRDAPLARLGRDWWVFAVSGTGDAWLMSLDEQQRIAFLDHDHGPDATPKGMELNFAQWLQMADLMRQWELADDEALSALMPALLEQINPGLSASYPYSI